MSTIKINTLTGTTSAGSILVTGEGGVQTTNLQQGLAKAFANLDGTAVTSSTDLTGVNGSFNASSLVDNTTGDFTINMTNGVDSTNNIIFTGSAQDDADNNKHVAQLSPVRISGGTPFTTSAVRFTTNHDGQTTTLLDMEYTTVVIHGDLAE